MSFSSKIEELKSYARIVWTSIDELLQEVDDRRWVFNPSDRRALEAFRAYAKDIESGHHNVDFIMGEISKGKEVRHAVEQAQKTLGHADYVPDSADMLAHVIGCSIFLIEKKVIKKAKKQASGQSIDQVRGLFGLYELLKERDATANWLQECALSIDTTPNPFDESEFDRNGGLAIVHLNKVDAELKDELVHGFRGKKPRRTGGYLVLERKPFILVVTSLFADGREQLRLA